MNRRGSTVEQIHVNPRRSTTPIIRSSSQATVRNSWLLPSNLYVIMYKRNLILFFCSPEHKVLMVSYYDWLLSIVNIFL